ncbi:MAG: hypothetical protein GTO41_18920, partial [Burkholderiales bacterium]|nr:hypothetical protein [Burkholderiales bacterium]
PIQGDELESIDEVATTAPVQQDGAVDVIEEFPIQRYEIDEPTAISQEEAEIERLRQELAASESELARIRAEEEQRDYPSSDALTSAETSGEAIGSEAAPAPAQQT